MLLTSRKVLCFFCIFNYSSFPFFRHTPVFIVIVFLIVVIALVFVQDVLFWKVPRDGIHRIAQGITVSNDSGRGRSSSSTLRQLQIKVHLKQRKPGENHYHCNDNLTFIHSSKI